MRCYVNLNNTVGANLRFGVCHSTSGHSVDIPVTIVNCCILFQVHYTSENVVEGKNAAKKALQQSFGLQQTDTPIVGIISRLTVQKGIHLIKHAIYRTLERNGQVSSLAH
jgi:glycogen synthase